jgi:hypothetical protein
MMHSESSGSTEWRAFLICDATHPFDLFRVNISSTTHLPVLPRLIQLTP